MTSGQVAYALLYDHLSQLPLEPIRPPADPAHPASRIGSNAQTKFMKVHPVGTKNLITHYRNVELPNNTGNETESIRINASNLTSYQEHPQILPLETSMMLLPYHRYRIGYTGSYNTSTNTPHYIG